MRLEDSPRFDQYLVRPAGNGDYTVVRLISNVDLMFAVIMAGITEEEFEQSVINTGWVGSCPIWLHGMPVVTMPGGDKLGVDQLEFMLESVEASGAV